MTDIIQDELLTIINEDIENNTIEKARDIIHGNIKEVDSKDMEDFVESNRGIIFRLSGLCIRNEIDKELNQLFTIGIVAHKKYTDELFFIPCIPITVMLAVGIFLFVLCK